jgi:hypothetical protein
MDFFLVTYPKRMMVCSHSIARYCCPYLPFQVYIDWLIGEVRLSHSSKQWVTVVQSNIFNTVTAQCNETELTVSTPTMASIDLFPEVGEASNIVTVLRIFGPILNLLYCKWRSWLIRQWFTNVTQCTNMTLARFADKNILGTLVKRQLSVEDDAHTTDDCRRLNSSLKRGHVFYHLLPATRRELDDFRFARVEFKTVWSTLMTVRLFKTDRLSYTIKAISENTNNRCHSL